MKNIKEYFSQTKLEIKKIIGSKLMIVFIAILLLLSIAAPILSTLDIFGPRYYYGYGYMEGELVVNDITIEDDSIFYWDIYQLTQTKQWLQDNATSSNDDLAIELVDILLQDYLSMANEIKDYQDYRANVVWMRTGNIVDIFIIQHIDVPAEDMQMILESANAYYRDPYSVKSQYYDISDEERQLKLENAQKDLALSDKIIKYGDHDAYFEYIMGQAQNEIESMKTEIERLEQSIIDDPSNESIFNEQIENIKQQIKNTEEIRIPIIEYRIANDIVPGADDWRDTALNSKEGALYDIQYNGQLKTQEEFEKEEYLKWQYGTYEKYKKAVQKIVDDATNRLQVAEKSMETGKPDMQFVEDGSRQKVSNFMWYSLLIAVFAAIFAGGLMAREFQSGTIRLLFIRPRSRAKIALSKFFALILICAGVYAASVILNLITNGIMFGFSDFGYPNYTISSGLRGVGFFAYIMPKLLACFVVVIFGASTAYFLSIVTRSTALSVSIPLVAFAGSLIAMQFVGYSEKYSWIVYTPLPYVNMPQILTGSYYSPAGIEPIVPLGIAMLLVISVVAIVSSIIILKKRDITN